jgi:hypothetical protein
VVGAAKTGTSSLYQYLKAHPEVFVSDTKELNFFVAEAGPKPSGPEGSGPRRAGNWWRGLEWYERQFAEANGARAVGEVSPRYAMHPYLPGVPERMAEIVPAARLVYIVRDPIRRMVSHYVHRGRSAKERRPIEVALTDPKGEYLSSSRYAHQVEQYLAHFPRSQLLVVISERLRRDRDAVLARIFDFLGVDSTWHDAALDREHHVSEFGPPRGVARLAMSRRWWNRIVPGLPEPAKRLGRRLAHQPLPEMDVPPELRARLEDLLREDVARLRRHVDDDGFDGWGIA